MIKVHKPFTLSKGDYPRRCGLASSEMLGWMKHKLESRELGEITTTSDMQMTPPYGRKQIRTKEPLDESVRVE